MLQFKNKCQNLEARVKKNHRKFNVLHHKGLPIVRDSSGQLIPLENYHHRLHEIASDRTNFAIVNRIISGKALFEGLEYDLFIQHEVQHLFITKPTFDKYTEVDASYRKVIKFYIPYDKR